MLARLYARLRSGFGTRYPVFVDGVPTGEATIPATMGNLESGLPVGLGAFVYPPGGNLQHFHQGAFADVHFFPAALTEEPRFTASFRSAPRPTSQALPIGA